MTQQLAEVQSPRDEDGPEMWYPALIKVSAQDAQRKARETVAPRNNRRTADGDRRHPSQPSWTEQGFEVGVGPSVVVADQGFAKSTTTTTVKDKVYAFIFDQKGAMYALGIQGNKITKIKK